MSYTTIWVLFVAVCVPTTAHAYIDPASGSAIISAVIGLVVTGGVMIKSYWRSFTEKFLNRTDSNKKENR